VRGFTYTANPVSQSRPRPVWAGVAVRFADGNLVTCELGADVQVTLSYDRDRDYDITMYGDPRRYAMPERMRIELDGYPASGTWTGPTWPVSSKPAKPRPVAARAGVAQAARRAVRGPAGSGGPSGGLWL
jgi:hypothetical protein